MRRVPVSSIAGSPCTEERQSAKAGHEHLVDTSVWVDRFRNRNKNLVSLLTVDSALSHPLIVTELACGTPPAPRSRTLTDIATLPQARQATLDEVRIFIEREKLYGRGYGVIDLALLASALLTPGSRLWSLDRHLLELAQGFDVAFLPALQ